PAAPAQPTTPDLASTKPTGRPTPGGPRGAQDLIERLDGIRGWLGDLDSMVRLRSRIGLVLAAIAIGAAGAAVYLSLDAKSQSASNTAVGNLREQVSSLEEDLASATEQVDSLQSNIAAARSQASAASATATSQRAQIRQLRTQIRQLEQTVSTQAAAPAPTVPPATVPGATTPPDNSGGGGTGGADNSP
ncbi:MAG: hypothetical protein ACRDKV_07850, partial [Solirubrobacterales bacterium]